MPTIVIVYCRKNEITKAVLQVINKTQQGVQSLCNTPLFCKAVCPHSLRKRLHSLESLIVPIKQTGQLCPSMSFVGQMFPEEALQRTPCPACPCVITSPLCSTQQQCLGPASVRMHCASLKGSPCLHCVFSNTTKSYLYTFHAHFIHIS